LSSPHANYTKNALKVTALFTTFTDFAIRSHCAPSKFVQSLNEKERPLICGRSNLVERVI
jgi:hypothetical protein